MRKQDVTGDVHSLTGSLVLSPTITALRFPTPHIRSNANLFTLLGLHLSKRSFFFPLCCFWQPKHGTVNSVQLLHIMEIVWDDMMCYKESSGDLLL